MPASAWKTERAHDSRIMAASKPVLRMNHARDRLKVFAGNANPALAKEICQALELEQSQAMVKTFSDGEIYLQLRENVRGEDVFVIQSTCTPVGWITKTSSPRT